MNLIKKIALLFFVFLLNSCGSLEKAKERIAESKERIFETKTDRIIQKKQKRFYSSIGFALVYEEDLFKQGIIDKILNNDKIVAMHSSLKPNALVTIINPENSKIVVTKISENANYPMIFNIVVSKKIATILELDVDNPYVEIYENKKNETFIAKKSNTLDEEKKVAEKAPVSEVKMDGLSKEKSVVKKKLYKKSNFVLVVADFYYQDSANNLKQHLVKQTQIVNFSVKKITNNKYRLSAGPFKNFTALKSIYISLNNLGFEDLTIFKEYQ